MKYGKSALLAAALLTQAGIATAACDRDELSQTIDDYFEALANNDTSTLSLSSDVKYTENGYILETGEGLWETADEATFTRDVLDTETCSTVTQALIMEDGREIQFGVRLKLNDSNEISEIEHIIAREEEFAFNVQGIKDTSDVDWEVLLDKEERASRMAMRAAANDYFDMFVDIPEVSAPFADPCHRWENGTHTTPTADCSPKGLTIEHGDRRVPVVDREAGIAVAFVHFARNLPDMHMFKFRNGKIELVQAVIGPGGAGTMGWPDDTSLSRRTPPAGEQMSQPMNLPD